MFGLYRLVKEERSRLGEFAGCLGGEVAAVATTTLQPGDIIAFTSQDSANFGETVTHKIRSLTTDADGQPAFITYGTTTDTDGGRYLLILSSNNG